MCLPAGEAPGADGTDGPHNLLYQKVLTQQMMGQIRERAEEARRNPGEESNTDVFDVPQTSLKYNILPKKEEFPFALEVWTLPQTCDGPKAHTSFQISLNVR